MKPRHLLVLLFLGIIIAGAYGCSGGGGGDVTVSGGGTAFTAQALNPSSQLCAVCHGNPASSSPQVASVYLDALGNVIAGSPTIVAEYSRSLHNTEYTAACKSCHVIPAGASHPNPTAPNPDTAGVCLSCHATLPLPHFDSTGTGNAQYVDLALTAASTGVGLGCRACHNPHDTTTLMPTVFKDYSASGHGDVAALPWSEQQFKTSASCRMCHTSSGFLDRIVPVVPTRISQVPAGDTTKQTLYCIACHENYSYRIRTAGAVTATYTGVVPAVTYPTVGKSNLCLNCHVGRENGDSVKAVTAGDFTRAAGRNFVNSHYLTGGATLFASSGYEYASRSYTGPITHSTIGMVPPPATTVISGPCVGCHMTAARHTFKPVTLVETGTDTTGTVTHSITGITSGVCAACHVGANAVTPAQMNAESVNFNASLDALALAISVGSGGRINFYSANPYFFTTPFNPNYVESGACLQMRVIAWQTGASSTPTYDPATNTCTQTILPANVGVAGTGYNNMGAAFNLNMLKHDFGAFTHNSTYVKQLIYDSIDWIDNKNLDDSVAATIAASTLTATQKANATTYLIPRP
jgi:nitrate reductase cytochrome c-type subunit